MAAEYERLYGSHKTSQGRKEQPQDKSILKQSNKNRRAKPSEAPNYKVYQLRADAMMQQVQFIDDARKRNSMEMLAECIENKFIKEDFDPDLYAVLYSEYIDNEGAVKESKELDMTAIYVSLFFLFVAVISIVNYGFFTWVGLISLALSVFLSFAITPNDPLPENYPQIEYEKKLNSLNALVGQEDIVFPVHLSPQPTAFDVPPQD